MCAGETLGVGNGSGLGEDLKAVLVVDEQAQALPDLGGNLLPHNKQE